MQTGRNHRKFHRTLQQSIAKRIKEEQYTGGRLASIGDSGHPATVASIVVDVLIERGIVDLEDTKCD